MSLFAALEIQQSPDSKHRYSEEELLGKGLQRLSYTVESRYVTRGFKNHLKRLGLFNPAYRKQDRQQVFLDRPVIRRYSDEVSNRRFKLDWKIKHRSISGLKDLPRKEVKQQPLHVGTIVHSRAVFYPNPLLDRRERRLTRLPGLRAKFWLKKTFKKIVREKFRTHKEELGSNGPSQLPTNPVGLDRGLGGFVSKRVVIVSNDGKYPTLLGGQTFSSEEELMRAWGSRTQNFKFFAVTKSRDRPPRRRS